MATIAERVVNGTHTIQLSAKFIYTQMYCTPMYFVWAISQNLHVICKLKSCLFRVTVTGSWISWICMHVFHKPHYVYLQYKKGTMQLSY